MKEDTLLQVKIFVVVDGIARTEISHFHHEIISLIKNSATCLLKTEMSTTEDLEFLVNHDVFSKVVNYEDVAKQNFNSPYLLYLQYPHSIEKQLFFSNPISSGSLIGGIGFPEINTQIQKAKELDLEFFVADLSLVDSLEELNSPEVINFLGKSFFIRNNHPKRKEKSSYNKKLLLIYDEISLNSNRSLPHLLRILENNKQNIVIKVSNQNIPDSVNSFNENVFSCDKVLICTSSASIKNYVIGTCATNQIPFDSIEEDAILPTVLFQDSLGLSFYSTFGINRDKNNKSLRQNILSYINDFSIKTKAIASDEKIINFKENILFKDITEQNFPLDVNDSESCRILNFECDFIFLNPLFNLLKKNPHIKQLCFGLYCAIKNKVSSENQTELLSVFLDLVSSEDSSKLKHNALKFLLAHSLSPFLQALEYNLQNNARSESNILLINDLLSTIGTHSLDCETRNKILDVILKFKLPSMLHIRAEILQGNINNIKELDDESLKKVGKCCLAIPSFLLLNSNELSSNTIEDLKAFCNREIKLGIDSAPTHQTLSLLQIIGKASKDTFLELPNVISLKEKEQSNESKRPQRYSNPIWQRLALFSICFADDLDLASFFLKQCKKQKFDSTYILLERLSLSLVVGNDDLISTAFENINEIEDIDFWDSNSDPYFSALHQGVLINILNDEKAKSKVCKILDLCAPQHDLKFRNILKRKVSPKKQIGLLAFAKSLKEKMPEIPEQ